MPAVPRRINQASATSSVSLEGEGVERKLFVREELLLLVRKNNPHSHPENDARLTWEAYLEEWEQNASLKEQ